MCACGVRQSGAFLLKHLLLMGMVTVLAPAAVHAAVVSVGCTGAPGPSYDYPTITAALAALDPHVPNNINVEGTCDSEGSPPQGFLQIVGFNFLAIWAFPGPATISQVQTACGSSSLGIRPALRIVDSHQLRLTGLVISGGTGVVLIDSGVSLNSVTVENSLGNGISVNEASTLTLAGSGPGSPPQQGLPPGPTPNFVQNNCGTGIGVSYGSTANLNLGNTVQGNGGQGLNVGGSAVLNGGPGEQILIQDNQRQGVSVGGTLSMGGQVVVQNNSTLPADPASFAFPAGMIALGGDIGVGGPGVQILGNGGPGISVLGQGTVRLGNTQSAGANITISGNSEEGLRLAQMSLGQLYGGTTIAGNSGADATCDDTSHLLGDVTGIAVNKCKNTETKKK